MAYPGGVSPDPTEFHTRASAGRDNSTPRRPLDSAVRRRRLRAGGPSRWFPKDTANPLSRAEPAPAPEGRHAVEHFPTTTATMGIPRRITLHYWLRVNRLRRAFPFPTRGHISEAGQKKKGTLRRRSEREAVPRDGPSGQPRFGDPTAAIDARAPPSYTGFFHRPSLCRSKV